MKFSLETSNLHRSSVWKPSRAPNDDWPNLFLQLFSYFKININTWVQSYLYNLLSKGPACQKRRSLEANEACIDLSQFKQTSRPVISCSVISAMPPQKKYYIALNPDNISRCSRNEEASPNSSLAVRAANLRCMNSRMLKRTALADRFGRFLVRCMYLTVFAL